MNKDSKRILKQFRKNPTEKNFLKLEKFLQVLLYGYSLYAVETKQGDVQLAKRILSLFQFDFKRSESELQMQSEEKIQKIQKVKKSVEKPERQSPEPPSDSDVEETRYESTSTIEDLPSLLYIQNFLTETEENRVLRKIDKEEWSNALSRRVQHYGYIYDYKKRGIGNKIGELPKWSEFIVDRLLESKLIEKRPNQLIINEYNPGQGIASHTDAKVFGSEIVSITLNSGCTMEFQKTSTDGENRKEELYLEPRSALVLTGEARAVWRHAIIARKTDTVNGKRIPRGRRVSLTFRRVDE